MLLESMELVVKVRLQVNLLDLYHRILVLNFGQGGNVRPYQLVRLQMECLSMLSSEILELCGAPEVATDSSSSRDVGRDP